MDENVVTLSATKDRSCVGLWMLITRARKRLFDLIPHLESDQYKRIIGKHKITFLKLQYLFRYFVWGGDQVAASNKNCSRMAKGRIKSGFKRRQVVEIDLFMYLNKTEIHFKIG